MPGASIFMPARLPRASRRRPGTGRWRTSQPDTSVFKEFASQPEFTEETWQYINRRVSDWRIINGKTR